MHEYFDADGNPCRAADAYTTVVTRESEWDDQTRDRVLDHAAYKAGICGCGCGLPVAQAHAGKPMDVHTFTCDAGRALAQKRRMDAEEAKEMGKPDGWNDGLHYYVIPTPQDDEKDGAHGS